MATAEVATEPAVAEAVTEQAAVAAPTPPDAFGPLVDTLVDLGRTLARQWSMPPPPATGDAPPPAAAARSAWRVEPDPATGQPTLRIPMPSAELVAGLGQFLAALTARLTRKP